MFGWEEDNDLEADKTKIWMGRRQEFGSREDKDLDGKNTVI